MHWNARKVFLLLSVIIIFIAVSSSTGAADPQSPVVKLGVTAPLTGDFANYGEQIRKGVELARTDLQKEGIKADVIYEDVCLPADAARIINKLISVDKINALAANFCVNAIRPMAAAIESNKIVSFHTASVTDAIINAGDFVFGTNVKVRDEARKVAEYARNILRARTASIHYIATDFGENYNSYFTSRFQELGGKVLSSDGSPIGVNDFKTPLTRIKGANPDVFFVVHAGVTLGFLLKQKQQIGIPSKVIGVYEAEDPSVLEVAGSAAEGILYFSPEAVTETENAKKFRTEFRKRYSEDPRILGSNSYDGAMIAAKTLASCNLNPDCAREKIYQIRNYDGVSGRFSFDQDGGVQRGLVLKTVQKGKFNRVE